jgi:hypothetical protein
MFHFLTPQWPRQGTKRVGELVDGVDGHGWGHTRQGDEDDGRRLKQSEHDFDPPYPSLVESVRMLGSSS